MATCNWRESMNKNLPLSLLGFAALFTSASTIIGQAPTMTITRNGILITAHFDVPNYFSGNIDISNDDVIFGKFKLIIADAGVAERLEAELGEYDIELPSDFGLGGTVNFEHVDIDGAPLDKIDMSKILAESAGLADGVKMIRVIANKHMADGETNHFGDFVAELKQLAVAA